MCFPLVIRDVEILFKYLPGTDASSWRCLFGSFARFFLIELFFVVYVFIFSLTQF